MRETRERGIERAGGREKTKRRTGREVGVGREEEAHAEGEKDRDFRLSEVFARWL